MSDLAEVQKKIKKAETSVNQAIGAKQALEDRISELSGEVDTLNETILLTEKAMWLLQDYSKSQQQTITSHIEEVVTKGLQAVFQNESLEFKLTYSETKAGEKKKTPEVAMNIWYDDSEGERVQGNLRTSFGGGLSVVAAILLRIAITLHLTS
ncbi:MAG: hypothetical protein NWE76_03400, partial [Candidatus Bathyarchaeota archaeon]|nr:hypothetical protein [Candidatus Bathyarchaeota archaeon]